MKQIVLQAPGEFIARDVRSPKPSPGEALVRICAVGVCGSDFHAFAGKHPAYTYPRVLGHELAGVVVGIPESSKDIRRGDRCAIEPYISCGKCSPCLRDRTNCCEQLRVIGIHVDGGMQAFLSVPIALLHKSDVLSLDQLALIETLGIGAHAVERSQLSEGEEALVIGAGPIGLAVAQFAQAKGAKVRVVEKSEWRRAFVTRMGFLTCHEAGDWVADAVFDATGHAGSMGQSLHYALPGGRIVYVGLTRENVSIEDPVFHRRELTLLASRNSRAQFPRIIRMMEDFKIDTSAWVTDHLTLSQVPERFANLPSKETLIKAIVHVNEADA
jgi:2-desacetyl-2-hydroxyethyl bacteriochlorophyllide A dehydrogenase